MSDIIRRHGSTGIHRNASDDIKHAVYNWDWLLPRSGRFTTGDLARAIRRAYCADNPKTAYDLAALESGGNYV